MAVDMVLLPRVLSLIHFVFSAIALGLQSFGVQSIGATPTTIAGNVGNWLASVIAWSTPAFLLASNAGNAGYTAPVKRLGIVYFLVLLLAVFLSFWLGYSSVFFDPTVAQSWVPIKIAALVFITLDFLTVIGLIVVSIVTQTATSMDSTRSTSILSVVVLLAQVVCLGVLFGVTFIWEGILQSQQLNTDLVLTRVGLFITFVLYTSPSCLLVMRSSEGGMLGQDILWNVVCVISQGFFLIMTVFVGLGPLAVNCSPNVNVSCAPAIVALVFGAIYALVLVIVFILTFTMRAKEASWERSSDQFYADK